VVGRLKGAKFGVGGGCGVSEDVKETVMLYMFFDVSFLNPFGLLLRFGTA